MITVHIPAHARATLRLGVAPDARFGRYVRERVVGFAAELDVPDGDAEEFVTAVAEAFANAVEHARTRDAIEVACWMIGDDQLFATVVDRGVGFHAEQRIAEPRLPDMLSERGRGLPIMRRLSHIFDVRSAPGEGTAVILGRQIGAS